MSFIQNFILSALSFLKILLWSKPLKSNKKERQKNQNKKLIVVVNGPSFRKSLEKYSEIIKQTPILTVNLFCCYDFFEALKPKHYLLLAPQFFKEDKDLSELYIKNNEDLFSSLATKTSWEMNLYVPIKFKKSKNLKELKIKNKKLKIQYFNSTPIEGLKNVSNFFFSQRLGMPRPHNVLIPSLMVAISNGFKKIAIIGADHSWLSEVSVSNKNEALVNQKHFYDESTSKSEQMNDYIKRPRKLHEVLHKFFLAFKGYWEIKDFAQNKKVQIVNSSETSMIDAFDRKSLDAFL